MLATSCRICSFRGETTLASPLRTAGGRGARRAPHTRPGSAFMLPLTTREPPFERKEDRAFNLIALGPLRGGCTAHPVCFHCRRHDLECASGLRAGEPLDARIHPAGQSCDVAPRKALKPSVANTGATTARIHPAGQLGVAGPGQALVLFPGQDPIALPGYPTVTVSGSTVGRALPANVSPTPIPGQPGLGSAMVNGRATIIQLGTNRIVRYAD